MTALWDIIPETQQPIIVVYLLFLKDLVELQEYTSGTISSSFYISYKQLSFCWSVELEHTFYSAPRSLNDPTSLTTYTLLTRVNDTRIDIS